MPAPIVTALPPRGRQDEQRGQQEDADGFHEAIHLNRAASEPVLAGGAVGDRGRCHIVSGSLDRLAEASPMADLPGPALGGHRGGASGRRRAGRVVSAGRPGDGRALDRRGAAWLVRGQRRTAASSTATTPRTDGPPPTTTRRATPACSTFCTGPAGSGPPTPGSPTRSTTSSTAAAGPRSRRPARMRTSAPTRCWSSPCCIGARQPASERYDRLLRGIARFLVAQERADGSVLEYWEPVDAAAGARRLREVLDRRGLLRAGADAEDLPRGRLGAAAHRVADYLATRRDAAEGYSSRQPDHWAAYGLEELGAGRADRHARRTTRAGSPATSGSWSGSSRSTPAGSSTRSRSRARSSGRSGRATAALWRLAGERSAARRPAGRSRRADLLPGGDPRRAPGRGDRPDPRARGAWFADGYTQMDDQQHAMAALIGAREVPELRDELGFLAAGFLATTNAGRVALAASVARPATANRGGSPCCSGSASSRRASLVRGGSARRALDQPGVVPHRGGHGARRDRRADDRLAAAARGHSPPSCVTPELVSGRGQLRRRRERREGPRRGCRRDPGVALAALERRASGRPLARHSSSPRCSWSSPSPSVVSGMRDV